mmetsp:Transcript_20085/g.46978  ORF Transcript_20085/g.46978 Transcript_20085/m.46978 type:complete len:564 (+) Transcript_20085:819-2510(+)
MDDSPSNAKISAKPTAGAAETRSKGDRTALANINESIFTDDPFLTTEVFALGKTPSTTVEPAAKVSSAETSAKAMGTNNEDRSNAGNYELHHTTEPYIEVEMGARVTGNTPKRRVKEFYDKLREKTPGQRTWLQDHLLTRKDTCRGPCFLVDRDTTEWEKKMTQHPSNIQKLRGTCSACGKGGARYFCMGCHSFYHRNRPIDKDHKKVMRVKLPVSDQVAFVELDCYLMCHPAFFSDHQAVFDDLEEQTTQTKSNRSSSVPAGKRPPDSIAATVAATVAAAATSMAKPPPSKKRLSSSSSVSASASASASMKTIQQWLGVDKHREKQNTSTMSNDSRCHQNKLVAKNASGTDQSRFLTNARRVTVSPQIMSTTNPITGREEYQHYTNVFSIIDESCVDAELNRSAQQQKVTSRNNAGKKESRMSSNQSWNSPSSKRPKRLPPIESPRPFETTQVSSALRPIPTSGEATPESRIRSRRLMVEELTPINEVRYLTCELPDRPDMTPISVEILDFMYDMLCPEEDSPFSAETKEKVMKLHYKGYNPEEITWKVFRWYKRRHRRQEI